MHVTNGMLLSMMLAFCLSLGLTLAIGPTVIKELKKLRFGKKLYELGPAHQQKEGTPYMGGLMMIISTLIVSVLCCLGPVGAWGTLAALLAVSLGAMLVGFADDFIQMRLRQHDGLKPWQKIAGQVIVSVGFAVYCYFSPAVGSVIFLPFTDKVLDLGILYIPLMSLMAIFMINSSNLQDGLDGLEGTQTSVGCVAWAVIAVVYCVTDKVPGAAAIAVFALALAGAARGYLRFNRYPAKVFMGDTGSMFIGGAMVGMSMLLRQPLLIFAVCFTMVMSSVSVIMQRIYFKLTHGKRIFKMSPVHHHFEKIGYAETQIVAMYATITLTGSVLAVFAVLMAVIH